MKKKFIEIENLRQRLNWKKIPEAHEVGGLDREKLSPEGRRILDTIDGVSVLESEKN